MPRFIDRVGPNNIDEYRANRVNKDNWEADRTDIDTLLAMTDNQLQVINDLSGNPHEDVAAFRTALEDRRRVLNRVLRLWRYDTQQITHDETLDTSLLFAVDLGGAVVSSCGEEATDPATNVLQAADKWAHLYDHAHEIVLDIGTLEVFKGISIPVALGANAAHKLRGVDVYVARNVAGLGSDDHKMLTGVDFATEDNENLHLFAAQKIGRYVKLTNITTDNVSNNMRIESIKAHLEPKPSGWIGRNEQ